ncbi:MAG: DNA polymerase Y family protein [Arenicellales bacterium]
MKSGARHALPVFKEPEPGNAPTIPHRPAPLWLAVHFPWLAGEALRNADKTASTVPPAPIVVAEESQRGWLVYRASPQAHRQGVYPGMTISAASVICPGLVVRRRRPGREKQRLERIGDRMLSFSPVVCIQPPETVLIEVRGSVNLFGGLERLKVLIEHRLDADGHLYRIAGAPTPSAAKHLAHWGRDIVVEEKAALRSVLGAMPLALWNLDQKTVRRLEKTGIHTLKDLWRLPADGLARRFGVVLVREMDRLLGRHPDPQRLHDSPAHFSSVLMLDWSTDDLAQVTLGVEYLLRQWVDYLRRSERGTSGFDIVLLPEQGTGRETDNTRVDIGVRHISRDMDHLQKLTIERLSRIELAGPVSGLVLESRRIHPLSGRNGRLFEAGDEKTLQWQQSEELLAMHLGGRGLDILHTLDQHLPELAWSTAANPGSRTGTHCAGLRGHRPLWLLDPPRALPWSDGPSPNGGQSKIVKGPERIETGWWGRRDQRRDYYITTDARGRRLWVFQDLKHKRWYLHGLFS